MLKILTGTFIIYTKLLITQRKDSVILRKYYFYKTFFRNKSSADSTLTKGQCVDYNEYFMSRNLKIKNDIL